MHRSFSFTALRSPVLAAAFCALLLALVGCDSSADVQESAAGDSSLLAEDASGELHVASAEPAESAGPPAEAAPDTALASYSADDVPVQKRIDEATVEHPLSQLSKEEIIQILQIEPGLDDEAYAYSLAAAFTQWIRSGANGDSFVRFLEWDDDDVYLWAASSGNRNFKTYEAAIFDETPDGDLSNFEYVEYFTQENGRCILLFFDIYEECTLKVLPGSVTGTEGIVDGHRDIQFIWTLLKGPQYEEFKIAVTSHEVNGVEYVDTIEWTEHYADEEYIN